MEVGILIYGEVDTKFWRKKEIWGKISENTSNVLKRFLIEGVDEKSTVLMCTITSTARDLKTDVLVCVLS